MVPVQIKDLKRSGWWGENPPYHVPVFVLTHHAREPLEMDGGTTFHFITGGMEEALRLAMNAAGHKDVRIGGGVSTVRSFLEARLVDEVHLVISPVLLGIGEHLCQGLNLTRFGYFVSEHVPTKSATHIVLCRNAGPR
jgi:dihydrofolate reductase